VDITKISSPQQPKPRKLPLHNVDENVPTSDKPLTSLKVTSAKKELQMVDNDMEKALGQEDVKFDSEFEQANDATSVDTEDEDDHGGQPRGNGKKRKPLHGIEMDEDVNNHFEDPPSRVEKQRGSEKHIAKKCVSKDNSLAKKTKNKKGPLFERMSTTKTT
jgi:hypothetical protein